MNGLFDLPCLRKLREPDFNIDYWKKQEPKKKHPTEGARITFSLLLGTFVFFDATMYYKPRLNYKLQKKKNV